MQTNAFKTRSFRDTQPDPGQTDQVLPRLFPRKNERIILLPRERRQKLKSRRSQVKSAWILCTLHDYQNLPGSTVRSILKFLGGQMGISLCDRTICMTKALPLIFSLG